MPRALIVVATAAVLTSAVTISASGRIRQHGRAIVEYRSDDVRAVAGYEYSQRHHDGAWLLIEFAVHATHRIAIDRDQLSLVVAEQRSVPLATQAEFLEDQQTLTRLLQNATIWRRPLSGYFVSRPPMPTMRFFSKPGGIVHDSVVTNLDEVAMGDLFFKSPDGRWPAGTYNLVLNHEKARADLPIMLR
jgi:hypothetical protein